MENEGKVEQEQEILLFCLILEMKEDWKAGIDLLNGPLGQRLGEKQSKKISFEKQPKIHWIHLSLFTLFSLWRL